MYKFCPKCGGELNNLKCNKCGFVFYQNSKPTVSAIILNEKNEVLLAKRSSPVRHGLWGAPGGFLENGEDPIEGLSREVEEETGVKIEVGSFISQQVEIDPRHPSGEVYNLNLQYRANIISGEPKALHETAEVKWFGKDEIPWSEIAFPGVEKALKITFGIQNEQV